MTRSTYSIVGMKHAGSEDYVNGLPTGHPLTLVRDPTNAYDTNAIQVHCNVASAKMGFVKATEAAKLAKIMDAADVATLPATFVAGSWPKLEVDHPAAKRGAHDGIG